MGATATAVPGYASGTEEAWDGCVGRSTGAQKGHGGVLGYVLPG